jgi:hypothetical protein
MNLPDQDTTLGVYLYNSGITFFTLGYGDVTPQSTLGRVIAMAEAGVGFGVLAIVISYLPVIYQAFSRREVTSLLLDSRAGSPPTGAALLLRYARAGCMEDLTPLLTKFENWSAGLLEAFISYPVLAFYRAQHEQLSWLAALTAILDTCAMLQACVADGAPWRKALRWQAHLTFALARHVLVDLSYLLNAPPDESKSDRVARDKWEQLALQLSEAGGAIATGDRAWQNLEELRSQYEPYLFGLARYLILTVPPWMPENDAADSWQTSAWETVEDVSHF